MKADSAPEEAGLAYTHYKVILAFASSQLHDTMYVATISAITVGTTGSSSHIALKVAASYRDRAAQR
jgi:hypothetical protein